MELEEQVLAYAERFSGGIDGYNVTDSDLIDLVRSIIPPGTVIVDGGALVMAINVLSRSKPEVAEELKNASRRV